MSAPELVSLSEYARRRGVTQPAVQKAIKAGRLKRALSRDGRNRPRLDVAIADAEWSRRTDPTKQRKAAAIRQGKLFADRERAAGRKREKGEGDLVHVRTQEAGFRTRLLELELRQAEGEFARVADFERAAATAASTLKAAILNVPARIAGELAAETDARKVHDVLLRELRVALASVADKLVRHDGARTRS